ncbi:MAG: phytanoyl-CoA dioxygenase family protein [Opitutaceae bacterium]|nr:phytanoyl-CoA dioxygenase family protein [Opitutaceae bacterium]MBP9912562.1 phytanoyl-CoA dioxygenase family protein [Opitutaceae bacterium]
MPTPLQLSPAQIAAYHTDGFIVVEEVFSAAEVETLRAAEASPEIQTALREAGIAHKTVHLLELTTRHPAFLALARDPRLAAALCALLGPDVQLQHSKLATKPVTRGAGAFGWHQDIMFYPHTNTSLLSIFVYLDEATPENGCMSMVRGSHRLGPLNHLDADGHFDGKCREPAHWSDRPENVVPITPRAGGISIHHCLTLHGSPPNLSGLPRRGVVFSYRADDAQQLGDTIFRDTGLVVCGRRHGVTRCEAGSWLLPRRTGHNYGNAHQQVGDWAESLNANAGV